jgi:hypothetical protein
MKNELLIILTSVCSINMHSQSELKWYDFLNETLDAEGEYFIHDGISIDNYGLGHPERTIRYNSEGESWFHRPYVYYKPNGKKLLLWEGTNVKISEIEFDDIDPVGYNTIKVRLGEYFGIMDTNGVYVFQPEFTEIETLDAISFGENQIFYTAKKSSASSNNSWEVRTRNGGKIYDSSNPEMNPLFGKFGGIRYLYFNRRVHYAIEVRSKDGIVITTAIGEINGQPKYILPGGLEFKGSGFGYSDFPFMSHENYISLGMSKLELQCLSKIDATMYRAVPNSNRKQFLFNELTFFNLSLGREIEDKVAFETYGLGKWDFIFSLSDTSTFEVKRYNYIRKCAKDYELKLDSNYSTHCGQRHYALFDNELNQIIPFSDLQLEQLEGYQENIEERSVLEHFIITLKTDEKTLKECRGLFHLKYGTILKPEYDNIRPLKDIYRPLLVGKFWEVTLKSSFVKVYNVEKGGFEFEGKEFDHIIARRFNDHQKFFGVLDGVEFEIF